jgi:hypothetical protein
MATVIPDTSPGELLAGLRGRIVDAAPGYPEVIHLEMIDSKGQRWGLSTQWADYSPSDPDLLRGKTVVSADLVGPRGNLTLGFSDGTSFRVTTEPQGAPDDPFNWMLFTPDGFVLYWGPGDNWVLRRGNDPI